KLALSEIYLRDLAAREGRLDTPQFADEMAEIERQRTSIRDEIGDTAYDRYLAALDQQNRVADVEVLIDSPAAYGPPEGREMVVSATAIPALSHRMTASPRPWSAPPGRPCGSRSSAKASGSRSRCPADLSVFVSRAAGATRTKADEFGGG